MDEKIYGTKKSNFLRAIYFSARVDFSSSPLSAPGSPRMSKTIHS